MVTALLQVLKVLQAPLRVEQHNSTTAVVVPSYELHSSPEHYAKRQLNMFQLNMLLSFMRVSVVRFGAFVCRWHPLVAAELSAEQAIVHERLATWPLDRLKVCKELRQCFASSNQEISTTRRPACRLRRLAMELKGRANTADVHVAYGGWRLLQYQLRLSELYCSHWDRS